MSAAELWSTQRDTLAVLADTQVMIREQPDDYRAVCRWLVENAARMKVAAVLHVGDVVDNGIADDVQVAVAQECHDSLVAAGIPLFVACGNHDDDVLLTDSVRQTSMFASRLSSARYAPKPWFDISADASGANIAGRVQVDGRCTLIVVCEFAPRPAVAEWVEDVLSAHPDCPAVLVTHAYLDMDGELTRPGTFCHPSDYPATADGLDGRGLWEHLRRHRNLRLVVSGHQVPANLSHRVDIGDHGNAVLAAFQNWQMTPGGGSGRMRLVEGVGTDQIRMRIVNPLSGRFEPENGGDIFVNVSDDRGRQLLSPHRLDSLEQP